MCLFNAGHVTGCRCCDCEWTTEEDLLPDSCPSCGGDDVMYSFSDDDLWANADLTNKMAKENE